MWVRRTVKNVSEPHVLNVFRGKIFGVGYFVTRYYFLLVGDPVVRSGEPTVKGFGGLVRRGGNRPAFCFMICLRAGFHEIPTST